MKSRISPQQEKILVVVLFSAILISAFLAIDIKPKEKYTEFYILGENGKAGIYTTKLKLGDEGRVVVGVVNHEQKKTRYLLKAELDGEFIHRELLELNDGEKTLHTISFRPLYPGKKRLEFTLFKDGNSTPYLSLHLYLEVVK